MICILYFVYFVYISFFCIEATVRACLSLVCLVQRLFVLHYCIFVTEHIK